MQKIRLGGNIIKWKTDFEKSVVLGNFERREWSEAEGDEWIIYWASVGTMKHLMNPEFGFRFRDEQQINHFPNHYELTRKDLMAKNLKRYKRELLKKNISIDFVPLTYSLPSDYSVFIEEFRRQPNSIWIAKPIGRAQGKGIFIVHKLSQMRKYGKNNAAAPWNKEGYVISRYIDNPLLIGGKKFDVRLYVLVTSYRPSLVAYIYREGFARFCNVNYSNEIEDIGNKFMHLTNVAIQKNNTDYNRSHGGKWKLYNLRLYIESTRGKKASDDLFGAINDIILHSLKAVQSVIANDKHCFECYGYDIIIDDELKPWLVEVNASPSLSPTTIEDRNMKSRLIRDVLDIVLPDQEGAPDDTNHFEPVYDDEIRPGTTTHSKRGIIYGQKTENIQWR